MQCHLSAISTVVAVHVLRGTEFSASITCVCALWITRKHVPTYTWLLFTVGDNRQSLWCSRANQRAQSNGLDIGLLLKWILTLTPISCPRRVDADWKTILILYHLILPPCSCGWVYIGDTKGVPEIRLKEPKAATRRGELEKSTIDQHAWNQTGRLGWSCGVGRGGKQHYTIHKRNSLHPLIDTERLINRDEGITISDCWTAFSKLAMTSASVASSSRNQWWSMLLIKCRSQAGRSLEWSKVEAHDKGTGAAQLNFVSVN